MITAALLLAALIGRPPVLLGRCGTRMQEH